MEQQLVVYADYVCPYCYLAEPGLRRLQQEGVALERAAFELRPQGTPLPEPGAAWMRTAWDRRVAPLAQELGLVMRFPQVVTRTRKAHEAAAYARSVGRLEEMHAALYSAYWEQGLDIGRIDILVEVGAEAGLDQGGLRVALDIDQWTERVESDVAVARELGLTGVPAYELRRGSDAGLSARGEVRVGVQRYDDLRAWVKNA